MLVVFRKIIKESRITISGVKKNAWKLCWDYKKKGECTAVLGIHHPILAKPWGFEIWLDSVKRGYLSQICWAQQIPLIVFIYWKPKEALD